MKTIKGIYESSYCLAEFILLKSNGVKLINHGNLTMNGQNAISLISFKELEMASSVAEIPSGVKLIHDLAVWEKSKKGRTLLLRF
ncbi:hypothetical protein ACTJJY_28905 [Bacillus sp. 22475]|uniref:hypothetical protein n=1 Tax=Bacillus sp. 22475 TaxID=3453925 RepID=UPI003F83BB9A